MPGSFQSNAGMGVPNVPRTMPAVLSLRETIPIFELPYTVRGVTKNSSGAALASCPVVLYRTADDSVAGRATSDASGNYRIDASPAIAHYLTAYLAGSPDVAGTTVNTVVGTPD